MAFSVSSCLCFGLCSLKKLPIHKFYHLRILEQAKKIGRFFQRESVIRRIIAAPNFGLDSLVDISDGIASIDVV